MPWGTDNYYFRNFYIKKQYDVLASYTSYRRKIYPLRSKIHRMLVEMDISSYIRRVYFEESVLKINQSRICINTGSRYEGFINPRVTEVMSCGSFLLSERNDEFESFGYQDGKHLVLFDNLIDLKEKILYYLEHENERKKIALEGMHFVRKNYSLKNQVSKFLSILKQHI